MSQQSRALGLFFMAMIFPALSLSGHGKEPTGDGVAAALASINDRDLRKDIEVLASDEYEGRGPSTRSEEKTLTYFQKRFSGLGLQPANEGSFFQEIPLVEITTSPEAILSMKSATVSKSYRFNDEFVAATRRMKEKVGLESSDLVFAGYGIVAPEYGWNDYEGLDVRGRTVIVLVNDPGFVKEDPGFFLGKEMTYYGRWTYKYEEAARQGAAGIFIVHETEPAAYPWAVVDNSFTGPQMNLLPEDGNEYCAAVEGWIPLETARDIFAICGRDYEKDKAAAAARGFKAFPLGATADISLENKIRNVVSSNVAAVLPGGERADECIIYMAHWDHLGIETTAAGDGIYNGALDNASGVAGILELAEAFTRLGTPPARSILFLAVTCEEQGLLGSEYYAEHPIFPLQKTVAVINLDALNILGRMKDITVVGYGKSQMDDYIAEAAASQGRTVAPDPDPEKGSIFRSDHFSLAKVGLPFLYAGSGTDHVEHGKEWAKEQRDKYIRENYHKPSDEYDPSWDLTGAVEDLKLLFLVGYRLSGESTFPDWNDGVYYQAIRDEYMNNR